MNDLSLLKNEKAFQKLFLLFKKKFQSLGRIGGTVSIKDFSPEEIAAISGLTGYPEEELLERHSISLLKFEEALQFTRFKQYSLLEFLEAFFGEAIVDNKKRQEIEKEQEAEFIEEISREFPAISWYIDWITKKSADSRMFWSLYLENKNRLCFNLMLIEKAFLHLVNLQTFIRVPLFAQKITGNPHAFDRNEILGKMLFHLLTVDQHIKGNERSFFRTAEDENELLGLYKLLRDDLWSFVTLQNLLAEINNELHPVWKVAHEYRMVLNLPLKEIIKVEKIYPPTGKEVWVVENSSVASTLMDMVPFASIICTHGQLRLAGWKLIDLLVKSDTTIYYSGDLDPEGLQIADGLKSKYTDAVKLWRMDEETYEKSISEETISIERLSKLNKLSDGALRRVGILMKSNKKAAYQEAIVEIMAEDIIKKIR